MRGCLKWVLYIAGGIFLLLIAVTLFAPRDSAKPAPSSAGNEQGSAPAAQSAPAPAAFTVGQDALVGEVRWKILSAEKLGNTLKSDNQFIKDLTTSGTFVKVRFEIENRAKDLRSLAGLDLIDNQERKYTRSSNALSFADQAEQCVLENLNPGISKTCTYIYEVPADATGLKAYVGDLQLFGGDEAQIDLGL